MRWDAVLPFPKMKVAVATKDGLVAEIRYLAPETPERAPQSPLAERAARQLERYRDDPAFAFDLPLRIEGTEFQRRLWEALCRIDCGQTRTYGALAKELGVDARAVGQACGDNRLPVVIPCHRVVAANGLGGFAHATGGFLLEAKRWLLAHEAQAAPFALS